MMQKVPLWRIYWRTFKMYFYCFLSLRIHQDKSFHCEVCNVCLDKRLEGNHKCRPDSGHDECCICLEVRFNYYFLAKGYGSLDENEVSLERVLRGIKRKKNIAIIILWYSNNFQCWLLLTLLAGCIQWLPDITMFTQGPQRMCHRYDSKRHVSH